MTSDPVVLALTAALERQDSAALRLALGAHLVKAQKLAEGLAQLEAGLQLEPSNAELLAAAADAADALGDSAKAAAYRLAAGSAAPAAPAAPIAAQGPAPAPQSNVRRLRAVPDAPSGDPDEVEAPSVKFDDVGGMDEVKQRLARAFLQPIKNPELFKKFGKRIGGGLVLYGPPGCGKTFIARAVAGEIGARFMSVGLSDVLNMYLGESERRLHELFETARRRAPTVLFFDEVDALGQRRTHLTHHAPQRNVVNQLLSEIDGIGGKQEELFVLAATNHPWDLDPALRRPGRFDRLVFVPPPDLAARRQILELKLRERPTGKVDLGAVAKGTEGFSGADLTALVDAAMDLAIERSVAANREVPLDDAMLKAALRDMRPSVRPWLETARNFALYANEGGTYDDLLAHLKKVGLT